MKKVTKIIVLVLLTFVLPLSPAFAVQRTDSNGNTFSSENVGLIVISNVGNQDDYSDGGGSDDNSIIIVNGKRYLPNKDGNVVIQKLD